MNTFQVSQNYYKKNKIMLSKSKRASTATATATASEFESVQKNEFDVKEKDEGKSTKKSKPSIISLTLKKLRCSSSLLET